MNCYPKGHKDFTCKLLGVVRILADMEILIEISALLVIANALWFASCYRENKRRAARRMRNALKGYIDGELEGKE